MQSNESDRNSGWVSGFLGVAIFSGTLPATRLGVIGFSPLFLTSARALIAAALCAVFLAVMRVPRPERSDWPSLGLVALGVVLGYPLFSALALEHITSARSAVFVALLPLATALFAVLRAGERPKPAFWIFALAGAAIVCGFALMRGTGAEPLGDALMVAAVLVCALGYAEGAQLTRKLGGWPTIAWALILSTPLAVVVALASRPASFVGLPVSSWLGLGYVALFSMILGVVLWYRGLVAGGIARVGQLQLLQTPMGLALAALVLNEAIPPAMILTTLGVIACVAGARRFA